MWPLLGYIDFRCFIFFSYDEKPSSSRSQFDRKRPPYPHFLFHFWNPDNFSILYVKFEENLMDFKNGPNTVNVFKWAYFQLQKDLERNNFFNSLG